MPTPKVSIVIGTYNHLEDCLRPCVDSIKKYTNLADKEIIVVANGCTDGTKEYLQNDPAVKGLWFDEPLGFSKAYNAGIKVSTGEYVVLLNNDTVLLAQPTDTWINMLVKPFSNPKVGITGPILHYCPHAKSKFFIFFCVMIKREVIDKIGILDERFGVGAGEDTDFSIRAMDAGYELVQVPSVDPNLITEKFQVGGFPIYHRAEATVGGIPGWAETFERNGKILEEMYEGRVLENVNR